MQWLGKKDSAFCVPHIGKFNEKSIIFGELEIDEVTKSESSYL